MPAPPSPPPFDFGGMLTRGLLDGAAYFLRHFWYVIPLAIGAMYLRAKVDRADEKARTFRRVRDEEEAREKLRAEKEAKQRSGR
jgi:hypothetical protein